MTVEAAPELRHIIVAAGTQAEWSARSEADWYALLDELGKVADHVGALWLTVRPFGPASHDGAQAAATVPAAPVRSRRVGGCAVSASPVADGRVRLAAAMERLRQAGIEITEAAVHAELNAPAEADPDLVVILGSPDRLPESLVWELAYSELVFLDIRWADLTAQHVEHAIASYAGRHRRFGGVD